ncbi:MAG: tRNA (cytidine(34)-2'-O)-methyltransferase [Desulfobacteraceae bacterium]|nr:MAG: tRNA (cytidine(34)-2'-O)-methyltransferase [Desulfobacteraceae bacterium]
MIKNRSPHRQISNPALHIVLYQPEIPANTGNIARLCGAAELRLHLIHPLGFSLEDRYLKRAGLDYWQEVDIEEHLNREAFAETIPKTPGIKLVAFSSHASQNYTDADLSRGDYLLFGPESAGLPADLRESYPCYRVPIWGRVRSLNLSTTVGIVTYHYLHRMGKF